jgi:hypothetical protein
MHVMHVLCMQDSKLKAAFTREYNKGAHGAQGLVETMDGTCLPSLLPPSLPYSLFTDDTHTHSLSMSVIFMM